MYAKGVLPAVAVGWANDDAKIILDFFVLFLQ
jgi:hypothetical protein